MCGKIVPEIPVGGICPLECFDAGDMLELGEDGKYRIKGYENCTWITYKIVAYDNAGNNATKDNNGYGYKYHVIPEYPLTMMLTMLILTTSIATILLKKKGKAKPQLP
jgi:hypothetical protein